LDVHAIFVGNTVNPALAERVAADTGTQLIYVYTGSLSEPGGEADSYLAYMRYNTTAFVKALK
jgi:ABC-type Zn uptake system ZnuABC Zn-binding protein ZnuA